MNRLDIWQTVFYCVFVSLLSGIVLWILFHPVETEGQIQWIEYRYTVSEIEFKDGRKFRFEGQPSGDLLRGHRYKITYNNMGFIYKTEEVIESGVSNER